MFRTFAKLFLACAFSNLCREADAQSASGVVDTHAGVLEESTKEDSIGFRQGSVVVAPIPFSNPTVGSGLILGAGYLFTLDDGSDPSVLGIAGLKSDNGSMAGGVSLNFNFLENRWHIKTLFAKADVRYDLFTDNGIFPIQQDGILGRFSLSYGVTPDLSFGAAFRYLDTSINPDTPNLPPLPPPYNRFLDTTYGNAGVIAQWDTRDDTIYPTTGHNLEFEATKGYSLEGILKDYSKAFANYTHYVSPVEDTTIAARFSICGSSADTPFFDQCGLGTVDAFRGFSATQFLDLNSVSLQIEARQRLTKRIGVVAFAGTGLVGDGFGNLRDDGPHSAAGLGVRYRVSKKFPLDFSVDLARNDEQENNLYIYVGQRF